MEFKNEVFKQIRQEQRWSLASLAKESGFSRRSLTLWESGQRNPTEKNIRSLANFLNIPISSISGIPPEQPVSQKDISKSADTWLELSQNIKQNDTYHSIIRHASILNTKLEQASVIIRGLLTSMHSIFYIKDVNMKYIVANNSFLEILSLNLSYDVAGKTDTDFFPIKEAKVNHEQDKTVLQTGIALKNIEQYIPGSKKKKWSITSKLPIKDNDNKTIGILGIILDITEKRKSEKLRELLEIHIDAINSSIAISKSNFKKYLYLNKGHEKIYGYPNTLFYEKDHNFWLNKCIHPDDRKQEMEFIRTNGWPSKYEYRIVKPNGEIRWIESHISKNIQYQNQNCTIAIDTDITKRKTASNQRIMLQDVIDKIDDGIMIFEKTDTGTSIIKYINDAFKKIFGTDDLNCLNKHNIRKTLILPTNYKEIEEKLKTPKYPLTLKYEIIKPDNSKIITISEKIFNHSEKTYLSIIRDITSHVKEKEIRTLLEHSLKDSHDVIWMRKLNTHELIYVSESVTKLTDYPVDCFRNDADFWQNNCVHPDDKTIYKKYRLSKIWPRTLKYRIVDTLGNIKWIETILFYKSSKKNTYRAIDRDITEQINSELKKENLIRIDIAKKMIKHNIDPLIIADITKISTQVHDLR